jgi:hypothetical protein
MMEHRSRADGGWLVSLIALVVVAIVPISAQGGWTVTPRGSVSLGAGPVSGIRELSGVTYLGPQPGGLERFAAIQDENRRIIVFDVAFAANGAINSATAVSAVTITGGPDFEGIAYTGPARNSVFVSEENTPTIREFSLVGGGLLQSVALPEVFENRRDNRGLEALTRSFGGDTMWTANEEALTVDGPASTQAAGTQVRLQRMNDDGASVELGPQFAYLTDPIHSGSSPDRNGVPDLVMLPDDTLLVLERSRNGGFPPFLSSIYRVDFAGATDVSQPPFDSGLISESFAPVMKNQLWSGQIGGVLGSGHNVEGIGLGPQLANGNWVLLGVADNGGSGGNPIVSFELSLGGCSLAGDYNCSGAVDDSDYTLWKNTFGSAAALAADGNDDGVVDAADYAVWRDSLGAPAVGNATAVPELGTVGLAGLAALMGLASRRTQR